MKLIKNVMKFVKKSSGLFLGVVFGAIATCIIMMMAWLVTWVFFPSYARIKI